MSEDKYNEGNEIDANISEDGTDDIFGNSHLEKLRKKYEIVDYDVSIVEKKGDDKTVDTTADSIAEKKSFPKVPAGTPKTIIEDTHFDAFPSFLHISVPDSSSHQIKSPGIDMIMSELAELEANLPPDPDKGDEENIEQEEESSPVQEMKLSAEQPEVESETEIANTPADSQPVSEDLNTVSTQELYQDIADEMATSEDLAKDDEVISEVGDSEEILPEQTVVAETVTSEEYDAIKEPHSDRIAEEIYLNIPPPTQQTSNFDKKTAPFKVNINFEAEDGIETLAASEPQKGFKKMVGKVFPKKGDGIGESIRKMVLFIAVLTMIVCSGILLNIYLISPYVNSLRAKGYVDLKTTAIVNVSKNIKDEYPGVVFPIGIQPEYVSSFAHNKDFVGWLEIPAIGIDMPIVQSKNNLDYLKKNFDGKKDKFGCCFVDYNNNIANLDQNTVIYGHNTRNGFGTMFVPLEKLRTIDGFKTAPIIKFNTIYSNYKWKVYAVFITNGGKSGDNNYVFNYVFKNLNGDESFKTYINQLDQRKLYTTGVDLLPTDKILTLSTCTYDFDNARLVVVARMLRVGESEDVNTSAAVLNANPRYPQAWYSAKGQSNPYRNAEKWFAN
ncbi:MAG: class B sortase [Eubacteriales bacterium]